MLPSLKTTEEQDLVLLARFAQHERGFEEIRAVIRFTAIPSFAPFLLISSLADPDRVTIPVPRPSFFSEPV